MSTRRGDQTDRPRIRLMQVQHDEVIHRDDVDDSSRIHRSRSHPSD